MKLCRLPTLDIAIPSTAARHHHQQRIESAQHPHHRHQKHIETRKKCRNLLGSFCRRRWQPQTTPTHPQTHTLIPSTNGPCRFYNIFIMCVMAHNNILYLCRRHRSSFFHTAHIVYGTHTHTAGLGPTWGFFYCCYDVLCACSIVLLLIIAQLLSWEVLGEMSPGWAGVPFIYIYIYIYTPNTPITETIHKQSRGGKMCISSSHITRRQTAWRSSHFMCARPRDSYIRIMFWFIFSWRLGAALFTWRPKPSHTTPNTRRARKQWVIHIKKKFAFYFTWEWLSGCAHSSRLNSNQEGYIYIYEFALPTNRQTHTHTHRSAHMTSHLANTHRARAQMHMTHDDIKLRARTFDDERGIWGEGGCLVGGNISFSDYKCYMYVVCAQSAQWGWRQCLNIYCEYARCRVVNSLYLVWCVP